MKWKNLILGFTLIISIFIASSFILTKYVSKKLFSQPVIHQIVLKESGFVPSEIMIAEGDIVEFSSTRGVSFWPASNLHPIHEIYPEFDSRSALEAEETWSFTFDKVGTWKFHDHLTSPLKGVIDVTN